MTTEPLLPPELRLVHGTTLQRHPEMQKAGAQVGELWHSLRRDARKEVTALLLQILAIRTYWGRAEIEDEPPICSAISDLTQSLLGQDCMTCEHREDNPWAVDRDVRRTKCTPGWLLYGLDLDEGLEPFILRATGASASVVRQFHAVLQAPRYRRGGAMKVKLSSVMQSSGSNTYSVLQISHYLRVELEEFNEDEREWIRGAAQREISMAVVPSLPPGEPATRLAIGEERTESSSGTPKAAEKPVEEGEDLELNF